MAALQYPIKATPLPGQTVEVAAGVHWLRMPLPFSLNHINLWALEDEDGWTLVDTGVNTPEIVNLWRTLIGELIGNRVVKRVICTHMHPDHMGMSGWLTRRFNCQLWTTRLEYITCRMLVADTGREAPEDALRFYRAAGWDAESIEHYKSRFGGFGRLMYALPDSYRRVVDGESLMIGGRVWHAVVGRGHSPEHLCLYCPEMRLLISGDQVLPRISSNISVFPTEPEADPLTDWLESLAAIRSRVADDVLVLPAHNLPFEGLHARIGQLIDGHEEKLRNLLSELAEPRTSVEVFDILFRSRVDMELLQMATGESLAHLNCLIRRGQVASRMDDAGVAWYQAL